VDAKDGAQGSKRSAVILELTQTDRVGFLKQANRLLVAWSRGTYALYVVANANKLARVKHRGTCVQNVFHELRHQVIVPEILK
jgi:hypothetical protein